MTAPVVSIEPDAPVLQAVQIMLQRHISGLPVIDKDGNLVGMVTEGDFLRRIEVGTQRRRPRWLEFLVGPGRLADEYRRLHGRKVVRVVAMVQIHDAHRHHRLENVILHEKAHALVREHSNLPCSAVSDARRSTFLVRRPAKRRAPA